mmetsp:Transcript_22899/g.74603  ORF Transcript_22899/g.74603 Transcript_22899/m.74603 type:complete len:209 (-) Transcript_22899:1236-1862(-)
MRRTVPRTAGLWRKRTSGKSRRWRLTGSLPIALERLRRLSPHTSVGATALSRLSPDTSTATMRNAAGTTTALLRSATMALKACARVGSSPSASGFVPKTSAMSTSAADARWKRGGFGRAPPLRPPPPPRPEPFRTGAVASVLEHGTTWTVCSRRFALTTSIAALAIGASRSNAYTASAPARAAIIAVSPAPAPTSTTTGGFPLRARVA